MTSFKITVIKSTRGPAFLHILDSVDGQEHDY